MRNKRARVLLRPVGGTVALPTSWRRLSQPRCAREGCRNSLCMASFASLPPKGLPPRPPDNGSFPLDHFRECSDVKAKCMECLKLNGMKVRPSLAVRPALVLAPRPATCHSDIRPSLHQQAEACKKLSGSYLKCRMERCAHLIPRLPTVAPDQWRYSPARLTPIPW